MMTTLTSTPVRFDNAPRFGAVLAGDIGGRGHIRLKVFNEDGDRLSVENAGPTAEYHFEGQTLEDILTGWAEKTADLVAADAGRYQQDPLNAIGLAFPGTIVKNRVLEADNLAKNTRCDWDDIDLESAFTQKLKETFKARGLTETLSKNLTVTMANDLVAGTLGERYDGAAKDMKKGWLFVTMLGTGYGGATMLVTPEGGVVTPGEPGQLSATQQKIIEDFAAGNGMLAEAKATGLDVDSPHELIANTFLGGWASPQDGKRANQIINKAIRAFANSLAGFVQMFNLPKESGLQKRILIGGGVVEDFRDAYADGILMYRLKEELSKRCRNAELAQTDIAFSKNPDNLLGAAVLATLPQNPGLQLMG